MSSVKTVLIIIIGTLILAVVAYGSWFASSKVFQEPEVGSNNNSAKAEFDKDGNPTSVAVANYKPKQVQVTKSAEGDLKVTWETDKSTTTFFYVTYDQDEVIADVLKDWGTHKGNAMETTTSSQASTAHAVTIPKYYWEEFRAAPANTDKKLYYYIIVNLNEHRIPYGDPSALDSTKGPTQGYPIDLTTY